MAVIIVSGVLLGGGVLWAKRKLTQHFDTLIIGGLVVDGLGTSAEHRTIGIRDSKIVAVDWPYFAEADQTIRADGLIVCPGFIDVHTHIEGNLRAARSHSPLLARNFLTQGTTTIITGNCGTSALSLAQFFNQLETQGVQINVGSLVGHNSIRREVMGEASRTTTNEELARMCKLVERAMRDGALGFSTGLEYNPGAYASREEIQALAAVAGTYNGIYATHMRDEGNQVLDSLSEALTVAKNARVRLEVSHLKSRGRMNWGRSEQIIHLLEEARDAGVEVTCDIYPYTASSTSLDILFSKRDKQGGVSKLRERLRNPQERERIVLDVIKQIKEEGWQDFSFARVASCGFAPEYDGLTIPEITRLRAWSAKNAAKDSLREMKSASVKQNALLAESNKLKYVTRPSNRLEKDIKRKTPEISLSSSDNESFRRDRLRDPELVSQSETICYIESKGGAQMIYQNMNERDVRGFALLPYVMLGSDSGIRTGEGRPHPRGYGSAPRLLASLAVERQLVSIEEAVRKMTSLPADTFRLGGRGRLLPSYWADILIIDPVLIKDKASYDQPFLDSEGIIYVWVNGSLALDHGQIVSTNSGQVIRH